MKKQLELKEIVGYLPYGLKVLHTYYPDFLKKIERVDDVELMSNELITFKNGCDWYFNSEENECDIKPILFPISSLTQFREDLGFVPMVELLAISNNKFRNITQILCETKMYDKREFCTIEYVENGGDASVKSFSYDSSLSRFITRNESEKRPLATGYQLQLFEKLYDWKIDIHNLIEKGLAIAVTEEFNPYK
jgi:hypothetical protein